MSIGVSIYDIYVYKFEHECFIFVYTVQVTNNQCILINIELQAKVYC